MMNFLFPIAFLGLLTLSWPIYLHLRRRRRRQVREIPSIRLFHLEQKRTRHLRLHELLLLICRLAMLILLVSILAQPVVESYVRLPFHLQQDERGVIGPTLGLLLDDSISSLHAKADGTRFAIAKRKLREALAAAPSSTTLVITTTTAPTRSLQIPVVEAPRFLDAVKPLPENGDAGTALQTILSQMSSGVGAVLIAAPRTAILWPRAKLPEAGRQVPLHFLDLTDYHADAYIRKAFPRSAAGDAPAGWLVELQGESTWLKEKMLLIKQGESSDRKQLTLADAVEKVVPIGISQPGFYRLQLLQPYEHPWFHYFFHSSELHEVKRAVILRAETAAAIRADKIISAILQAGSTSLTIAHRNMQALEEIQFHQGTSVICIGNLPSQPDLQKWFDLQLANGVNFIFLPLPYSSDEKQEKAVADSGSVLRWQEQVIPTNAEMQMTANSPLHQIIAPLISTRIEPLQLPAVIQEPYFTKGNRSIVQVQSGHSIVSARVHGTGGVAWAVGIPVQLGPDSFVMHPFFPLLLNYLIHPENVPDAKAAAVPVAGDRVKINEWLGLDELNGILRHPDGTEMPVQGNAQDNRFIRLMQPGQYEFEAPFNEITRFVNAAREPVTEILSRTEWEKQTAAKNARWLTPEQPWRLDYHLLPQAHAADVPRNYDPAAILLALLAVLLCAEIVFVALLSQPRQDPVPEPLSHP